MRLQIWWRKFKNKHPWVALVIGIVIWLSKDWLSDVTRARIAESYSPLQNALHMVALNLPFLALILVPSTVAWLAIKSWLEAKREIDARKDLYEFRRDGVQLRGELITFEQYQDWESRFENWHSRTLATAKRLDEELWYRLSTLNAWQAWNLRTPVSPDHKLRLEMISEILDEIEEWFAENPL